MYLRRLGVLALLLAGVVGGGADAVEVTANGSAKPTAYQDGSACFHLKLGGPFAGVAAAAGLVRTGPVAYPEIRHRMAGPTEYFTGHQTFSTLHDELEVCVGGVGKPVHGGAAVFTLNAHSATSDVSVVLTCRYSRAGANCA